MKHKYLILNTLMLAFVSPTAHTQNDKQPLILKCSMDDGSEEFLKWDEETLWHWRTHRGWITDANKNSKIQDGSFPERIEIQTTTEDGPNKIINLRSVSRINGHYDHAYIVSENGRINMVFSKRKNDRCAVGEEPKMSQTNTIFDLPKQIVPRPLIGIPQIL